MHWFLADHSIQHASDDQQAKRVFPTPLIFQMSAVAMPLMVIPLYFTKGTRTTGRKLAASAEASA
jgi:hypothetical protein